MCLDEIADVNISNKRKISYEESNEGNSGPSVLAFVIFRNKRLAFFFQRALVKFRESFVQFGNDLVVQKWEWRLNDKILLKFDAIAFLDDAGYFSKELVQRRRSHLILI